MEWQLALLVIFGGLIIFMMMGMPVAFAFMAVNIIGAFIWWGGEPGLENLILTSRVSVATFTLLPIPLFILMGELMFRSEIGFYMIHAIEKWLGRLPGRLAFLTVLSGTLFATLSGSAMGSAAMLGSVLLPEMERAGYKKPMSLGPILGSGGLAIMIPPSALAVVWGAIADVSIGKILMAIIIPGLLMAAIYAIYIIGRCLLQPHLAPSYEVPHIPLSTKLMDTVRYVLPLGSIIFLVIGLIFLGVATATEAAATGTLGTFLLAAVYRRLNWKVIKTSVLDTIKITVMVFLIMTAAQAFSQILAFSGASRGLVAVATGMPVTPIFIIVGMMVVLLILGCFINTVPIMMITVPIFMPIVNSLGFDPVWFGVLFLINMEMAPTTPPFGLLLFVVKGLAPRGTTMADCYKAGLPFLLCDTISMMLVLIFPLLALWLPQLMTKPAL